MGSILSQRGSKLGQCIDALAQSRERFVTYELGSQDRGGRNGMRQEPGLASEPESAEIFTRSNYLSCILYVQALRGGGRVS